MRISVGFLLITRLQPSKDWSFPEFPAYKVAQLLEHCQRITRNISVGNVFEFHLERLQG